MLATNFGEAVKSREERVTMSEYIPSPWRFVAEQVEQITSRTPEMFRGRAFGLLTTFLFFGQFISAFVSQPISQQVGLGVTFALVAALTLAIGAVFFVGGRVSARRTPVPFNQH